MEKCQQMIRRKADEIQQNMFVIHQLVLRDKKRSLSSTFMGELWEVINPLINMVVMVLVFGKMFGHGIKGGFPLYVLTGTTIYGLFTAGTMTCLDALIENRNFMLKTQIDMKVYILEKILVAFRNFLFSLLIYAFGIAIYRIQPRVSWLLVIPDICLILIMMFGIGKMLAVINVLLADITYFYKIFTLILMYASALFYDVGKLSAVNQKIMLINPLYIGITIARCVLLDGMIPKLSLWIILGIYAIGCYILGNLCFNNAIEKVIAKL